MEGTSCPGTRPCFIMFGKYTHHFAHPIRPSYSPSSHPPLPPSHTRGLTRNEDVYPNPEVFNPDRFMIPSKPEVLKHVDSVWGFGRRVCPGKAFAESNLWLIIANTIAAMDVRKVLDEDGNPITPTAEYNYGTIRCFVQATRKYCCGI